MFYRTLTTFPAPGKDRQAGGRPRHRHRQAVRRRQDVDVHAEGRRQVAGRQGRSPATTSSTASRARSRRTSSPAARTTPSSSWTSPRGRQRLVDLQRARTRRRGQAPFDKAVSLLGQHDHLPPEEAGRRLQLRRSSLPAFAPFREDQDKGDKSNYAVFSDGPYKLQGTLDQGQGRHVRPQPATGTRRPDTGPQGLPRPDHLHRGLTDEVIYQRADQRLGQRQVRCHRPPIAAVGASRRSWATRSCKARSELRSHVAVHRLPHAELQDS